MVIPFLRAGMQPDLSTRLHRMFIRPCDRPIIRLHVHVAVLMQGLTLATTKGDYLSILAFVGARGSLLRTHVPPNLFVLRRSGTFALRVIRSFKGTLSEPVRLRSRQSLRAHCCRNVRALTHLTMRELAFVARAHLQRIVIE